MKNATLNRVVPTLLATVVITPCVWLIFVLYAAARSEHTLGEAASFWIYRFPLFLPLAFFGVCFWNRRKEFSVESIALSFLVAITVAPIAWGTLVLYIVASSDKTIAEAANHWAYQLPVSFVVIFATTCYTASRRFRNQPNEASTPAP